MSAPPKPWERVGQNSRIPHIPQTEFDGGWPMQNQRSTTAQPGMSSTPSVSRAPPPLPSRPGQQNSLIGTSSMTNRYGGYGSYGGGYGMGSMGGYGGSSFGSMYGGYGGMNSYGSGMYGSGYGGYQGGFGGPNGPDSNYSQFLRRAEESSRPAFQSIESIVMAFASVSMMMESTFQTVYNCFRAVLGVADHFSRLKLHLAKIFSAIAMFRTLRYLYRRLLVLLGRIPMEFANDIWKEVEGDAVVLAGQLDQKSPKRAPSWPIFMFFAVVVGGPYIIWKLLSSVSDEPTEQESWATGEDDHVVARAEFDFDSESTNEISFRSGAMLTLAPKELQPKVRGWVLASADGKKTGLVPHNYIKILGKRRGRKYAQQQTQQQQAGPSISHAPTENISSMAAGPSLSQPTENFSSMASGLNPSRSQVNLASFDKAFDSMEDQSDFSYPGTASNNETQNGADGWASWAAEASQNKVPQFSEKQGPELKPFNENREDGLMDTNAQVNSTNVGSSKVDADKT